MVEMPLVNQEKCNQCGLCITVCACGAIGWVENKISIIETEDCHWCTNCEATCPNGAISCYYEIIIEG